LVKIIFSFLLLFNIAIYAKNFVIVTNKNSDLVNIDDNKLKKIYLKKIKYIDEIKVKAVDNKMLKSHFDKTVLKKSKSQIKAYWAKMIFSGRAKPHITLKNDKEVINKIKNSDKNTIGYILQKSITKDIKVLKVIQIGDKND
jgi:ABC-type phosphate transport system substrate-binding protein